MQCYRRQEVLKIDVVSMNGGVSAYTLSIFHGTLLYLGLSRSRVCGNVPVLSRSTPNSANHPLTTRKLQDRDESVRKRNMAVSLFGTEHRARDFFGGSPKEQRFSGSRAVKGFGRLYASSRMDTPLPSMVEDLRMDSLSTIIELDGENTPRRNP